jgi:hypothetical protein
VHATLFDDFAEVFDPANALRRRRNKEIVDKGEAMESEALHDRFHFGDDAFR